MEDLTDNIFLCGQKIVIPSNINDIKYGSNIMGISKFSSADDVEKILGKPNCVQDNGRAYRYIFSEKQQLMLTFTDDFNAIEFYYLINAEE